MPADRIMEIITAFDRQGIAIDRTQASRFSLYYDLLIEKNKVMNLTRITGFEDALEKHFVDSVMIANYVDLKKVESVLDLGAGAGFPGIPLKIVYPHLRLSLIDSVGKKMQFVKEAAEALGLDHTSAMHVRAEDLAREKEHREQYDLCVSRAVANLSTLSEYCLPFVKTGGLFAAYKSADCHEEIDAAKGAVFKLGGGKADVRSFSLCGMGRSIVLIRKERRTPSAYPRKAGTAARSPLK